MVVNNAKGWKVNGLHHDNWVNSRSIHHNLAFPTINQSLENKINQRHLYGNVLAILRWRVLMVCLRSFSERFADYDCEFFSFHPSHHHHIFQGEI